MAARRERREAYAHNADVRELSGGMTSFLHAFLYLDVVQLAKHRSAVVRSECPSTTCPCKRQALSKEVSWKSTVRALLTLRGATIRRNENDEPGVQTEPRSHDIHLTGSDT